jgi:hypothetical protein
MRAAGSAVAASKTPASVSSGQSDPAHYAFRPAGGDNRDSRGLGSRRACARSRGLTRSSRLIGGLRTLFVAAGMSMASACTAWQTQENTLDQISTLNNLRYSQLLTNLSDAIDHPGSVPSQGVLSGGTATNYVTGSIGLTLTQPFAFARNTKNLSPTGTVNSQNNWSITPVSDPQDLTNLRALYSLLYRTDDEIARFILRTLILYAAKDGTTVDTNWILSQQKYCGITLGPNWREILTSPTKPVTVSVDDPNKALTAYLQAWNAFPQPAGDTGPAPALAKADMQFAPDTTFAVKLSALLNHPNTSAKPNMRVQHASSQTVSNNLKFTCFADTLTPFGFVNTYLSNLYGLLYPGPHRVFVSLRNGLSPACREYQIDHLSSNGRFSTDRIFQRWLFWRGAPYPLPSPEVPEYVGRYGNRDFWTTSPACLNDFILLTINATANSHAAAQNTPKQTGTTPAPAGGAGG